MNRAYVYIVFDRNGIPRYVGKGKGKRWKVHNFGRSHNKILAGMIRNAGAEFPVVIVRENLSDDDAFAVEMALIKAIGRIEFGGPLVNLSDGGDGPTNMSAEGRASISRSKKDKRLSKEHCENIGAGHRGLKRSDECRANMREAWEERRKTPEKVASDETRNKMSASAKKRDRSDGYSQSHKDAIRAGVSAFWERRRQAGLPLRHPGAGKGQVR